MITTHNSSHGPSGGIVVQEQSAISDNLSRISGILSQQAPTTQNLMLRAITALVDDSARINFENVVAPGWATDDQLLIELVSKAVLSNTVTSDTAMRLKLKAVKRFQQLLNNHGGTLTTDQVAQLTGMSAAAINKQAQRGALAGFKQDSQWLFLADQFDESGRVVDGVKAALKALQHVSPVDRVRFLISRGGADKTPLQALRGGEGAAAILRRAEDYMTQVGE